VTVNEFCFAFSRAIPDLRATFLRMRSLLIGSVVCACTQSADTIGSDVFPPTHEVPLFGGVQPLARSQDVDVAKANCMLYEADRVMSPDAIDGVWVHCVTGEVWGLQETGRLGRLPTTPAGEVKQSELAEGYWRIERVNAVTARFLSDKDVLPKGVVRMSETGERVYIGETPVLSRIFARIR
jgi:hypothetical protein